MSNYNSLLKNIFLLSYVQYWNCTIKLSAVHINVVQHVSSSLEYI